MLKFVITIVYLTLIINATEGKTKTITCVHRQVCNILYSLEIGSIKINPVLFKSNNPHHEQLSFNIIKEIAKSNYLILPPKSLIHDLVNIKFKKNKKVHFIKTSKKYDHFWLNKNEICNIKIQVEKVILKWTGIKSAKINCVYKSKFMPILIKNNNIKLIVLSHHALEFSFNKKIKILIISNQHGKINLTSNKLKYILSYLKQKKILFIEENQIPLPLLPFTNLLNAKNHLNVNTLGKIRTSPYEVLKKLETQIGQL